MFVTANKKQMFAKCSDCSIEDFVKICEEKTELGEYPLASDIQDEILIYENDKLNFENAESMAAIEEEWARAMMHGPGIIIIKGAVKPDVTQKVTDIFEQIIAEEAACKTGDMKDHFATVKGTNIRVWNALEKLAIIDPQAYLDYYSNDTIAAASRAWLGPWYQMTSQLNITLPGCAAQTVHRDFHLGYYGDELGEKFPIQQHITSPFITLQGMVAHREIPLESGPTLFLPHSQKYDLGYLAWRQEAFKEYFAVNKKQLPFSSGDAVFFNPALFHAAGENVSEDIRRMGNLLQVSSCMGRPMENVDRGRISSKIFNDLKNFHAEKGQRLTENAIASSAEGYSFPTNLDRDGTEEGLYPLTQAQLLTSSVIEQWPQEKLDSELNAMAVRHLSH